MKKLLLTLSLVSITIIAQSQVRIPVKFLIVDSAASKSNITLPEFPDGVSGFYNFLNQNLKWPWNLKGPQGIIKLEFTIKKDGNLTDVKVKKSIDVGFDSEAVRVLKKSPNWLPAMKNNKPVDYRYGVMIGDTDKIIRSIITTHPPIDKEPQFPGGKSAFQHYLDTAIRYPAIAISEKSHGTVFIALTIGEDGTVSIIGIARGLTDELDAEAIRVIKLSPKWVPAMKDGKPLRVDWTVPIKFTLPN